MSIENKDNSDLHPVILSASRSTDIPAFYSNWLLERIRDGFCDWINPFNRKKHRVCFDKTRLIVFWTKNPKPLFQKLNTIEECGFSQYYFQFTLNDYVAEGLEPNVPAIEERVDTFRRLADKIGKERVIWRFDPLLLTEKITIDILLDKIVTIGKKLKGYTDKLVFSFIDISSYRKVQKNLATLQCKEFSTLEQIQFAKGLTDLNSEFGFNLATCGEISDLSEFGIEHNKCIDNELIMRLFHNDSALMDFIGAEYDLFSGWTINESKKDKGQRKACGCIVSKDIGMYNTCPHLCRYCYANFSNEQVLKNFKAIHNNITEK